MIQILFVFWVGFLSWFSSSVVAFLPQIIRSTTGKKLSDSFFQQRTTLQGSGPVRQRRQTQLQDFLGSYHPCSLPNVSTKATTCCFRRRHHRRRRGRRHPISHSSHPNDKTYDVTNDEEGIGNDSDESSSKTTSSSLSWIHQWVKEQDPQWYQQYVMDIVGSDKALEWTTGSEPNDPRIKVVNQQRRSTTNRQQQIQHENQYPQKSMIRMTQENNVDTNDDDDSLPSIQESIEKFNLTPMNTLDIQINEQGSREIMTKQDTVNEQSSNETMTNQERHLTTAESGQYETLESTIVRAISQDGEMMIPTNEPDYSSSSSSRKDPMISSVENDMPTTMQERPTDKKMDHPAREVDLRTTAYTFETLESLEEGGETISKEESQSQSGLEFTSDQQQPTAYTPTKGAKAEATFSSVDDSIPSTSSSSSSVTAETVTTATAKAATNTSQSELDNGIIVFQNLGQRLQLIPLSNLTALGYTVGEVTMLQADALAVIVNDSIQRPRLGVPPQWKYNAANSPPNQRVRFVENLDEAEQLLQTDVVERQGKRKAEIEEARRGSKPGPASRTKVEMDSETRRSVSDFDRNRPPVPSRAEEGDRSSSTNSRARIPDRSNRKRQNAETRDKTYSSFPNETNASSDDLEIRNDITGDPPQRRRERERNDGLTSRRPQRQLNVDDDYDDEPELSSRRKRPVEDISSRRRQQRRVSVNEDGTPKRIYNGREILGQKPRENIGDPPPPNSPIWMDMDTFRSLLRKEAELRLRILGDGWAPTVKQESDWRLNLYKDWLWALHNGVASNAIVPPSRYERARRTSVERRRPGDETEIAARARRTRKRNRPPE